MTKLHDVPVARIQLFEDGIKSFWTIAETRWQLVKKTAHMRPQEISYIAEVPHKFSGIFEALYMGD
ncbi:hypothetical protein ASE04_28590 [Rhizobium sp. Root708]|nr:hypothetical protein ASE04_28590 [Rhizobium sp. Root708]